MVIVLIVLIILAVALIYMKREKFTELFYGGGGIL